MFWVPKPTITPPTHTPFSGEDEKSRKDKRLKNSTVDPGNHSELGMLELGGLDGTKENQRMSTGELSLNIARVSKGQRSLEVRWRQEQSEGQVLSARAEAKGCDEEKMNKLCPEEQVKLLWAISGVFQITDLFPSVHKEGPFTVDSWGLELSSSAFLWYTRWMISPGNWTPQLPHLLKMPRDANVQDFLLETTLTVIMSNRRQQEVWQCETA